MDDESETQHFSDWAILRNFISQYKQLPELWDVHCKKYSNREKKNSAYKKLLVYFKDLKNDSTIEDVKKKKKIH